MFENVKKNNVLRKTSFLVHRSRRTTICYRLSNARPLHETEETILRVVCSKERNWYLRKQCDAIQAARPFFRPIHEIRDNYMAIIRAVGYKKKLSRRRKIIKTLIEVRILRCGPHSGCRWHYRCRRQHQRTSPILVLAVSQLSFGLLRSP